MLFSFLLSYCVTEQYRNLSVKSPSKLRSSLIFQKKQPEDMQSAHNFAQTRIYNEEKAKLEKTLPVGSEYSMEGFLYYRVRQTLLFLSSFVLLDFR